MKVGPDALVYISTYWQFTEMQVRRYCNEPKMCVAAYLGLISFQFTQTVVRAASDQCRYEKDIKQSTQNNGVPTVFSACRHKIME